MIKVPLLLAFILVSSLYSLTSVKAYHLPHQKIIGIKTSEYLYLFM